MFCDWDQLSAITFVNLAFMYHLNILNQNNISLKKRMLLDPRVFDNSYKETHLNLAAIIYFR